MNPLVINQSTTPLILNTKKDVIKVVLYVKMLINNIKPFENDLDILFELFEMGGYSGDEEKSTFYEMIIEKKLRRSSDSLNNKLTEFVTNGILSRCGKNCLRFNDDYLPTLKETPNIIGFISKITHAMGK